MRLLKGKILHLLQPVPWLVCAAFFYFANQSPLAAQPAAAANPQPVKPERQGPTALVEVNASQIRSGETWKAIVGGTLIDGHGGPPIADSVVVVCDHTITAVGLRSEVVVPDEAEVLDATGKFVLPGLLDSHFHARDNPRPLTEFALQNGVTTVRDPGHPFKYYTRILKSGPPLPRIFLCGGHLDGQPPSWPDQAVIVKSPAEAADAVSRHVSAGASGIKIYFRVPEPLIRAACDRADQLRVPVTAHLELIDADVGIKAGLDGIEHITSFGTALAEKEHAEQFREIVGRDGRARKEWRYKLWSRIDPHGTRAKQLIALIVREHVFVSPTLAVFEAQAADDSEDEKAVAFANMLQFFGNCQKAGAAVVVGSHTHVPYAPRGKAYRRELELMVKSGMSPLSAITAATKTNADFFGTLDRLGTIEKGKLADIVIVGRDPLQNISHVDDVRHVMLNGRWMQPD